MEEQELVVPKEEEGTEKREGEPLIVQVRTIEDFLSRDGPSHIKPESEEETHRYWDSEWQEFLKSVSWLSPAPSPPPSEEDAKDFQVPLGRVKEEPQEESCGEARGEAVLPRDLNIGGKAWMDREKLDSFVTVKVEEPLEEVDLERQWPLHPRRLNPQEADEHQEGGTTMEEQELVVPKEEEGSERRGRDPLIVQVRTIGDFLSGDGPSHFKTESEEETHRRWDSQWQEFLKRVAGLPPAPAPLEEDAKDFQVPLGRVKEEPQEESCGDARGEAVLPRDPNIGGNAWMDREKLDFCMKVKVEEPLEEVDLERQWPLNPKQFSLQDADEQGKMSSKRKNPSSAEGGRKKQRKVISLNLKMKIIKAYEAGKKVTKIAREEGLAHSTISAILKDKARIREAMKGSAGMNACIIRQRKGLIHEMEKLLILWIEDRIQKRLPVSLLLIQAKARSIFTTLKERAGEECTETFTASRGWFMRFQQRFHYEKTHTSGEAASADEKAANRFLDELDDIIAEGYYLPEQIYNVDKTGLYWKRMPERTYIHKEAQATPGCKAFKDRVTLLLGGNVAGFKLKPFLIHKSGDPCEFKNISEHTLPIYYRSNQKAWMTHVLFEDWFMNCFIPQVKEYCWQNGIPFKILLLLDNAPGHPLHLDSLHPDVKE
ncbi:uncharacterized protein PHA67_003274 isoform 4-T6 [Liasis olivaceus]